MWTADIEVHPNQKYQHSDFSLLLLKKRSFLTPALSVHYFMHLLHGCHDMLHYYK